MRKRIMNLRYLIGSCAGRVLNWILSSSLFPLTRFVPFGVFWNYDVQRFSGTKIASTIFDVGANVGQTAYGIVRYWPNATLYCFEPVSPTMEILKKHYGAFEKIVFVNSALGSIKEIKEIKIHANSELNTLAESQPRGDDLTGEIEKVQIVTLDEFCSANNILEIDILKLDVQGWEMNVLRGASQMLKDRRIRFIYAEVSFSRRDSDMQYFAEINEFLEKSNFVLCGFYDTFRWGPRRQFVGFSNALYVAADL